MNTAAAHGRPVGNSGEMAIELRAVSKQYALFDRPADRLKQMLLGGVSRLGARSLGWTAPRLYREFHALRDVSFSVARGEVLGIIGRNGAGKSTLLQIICGTLQPTSGSVQVRGRIAALLELGAGFNPEFTGRENIVMAATILGLSAAEIDQLLACPDISEKARSIFEVAIFTGLRQGELWGLRWGDVSIDTERPECVARHSYDGPTKAGKVRRFPLLPRAAQVLRRVRERSLDTSPQDLVFPSPRGGMHSEGYDAGWSTHSRDKAGIRHDVKFHSFRHTCASHLLQGTWGRAWSITEVRDYLGHSSVSVTERLMCAASRRMPSAGSSFAPRFRRMLIGTRVP